MSYLVNNIEYHINNDSVSVSCESANNITTINLQLDNLVTGDIKNIEVSFEIPINDIHAVWHPGANRDKKILPDWSEGYKSKLMYLAPLVCFFSPSGNNRVTCAIKDATKDAEIKMGICEETANLACKVIIGLTDKASILIDYRDIPYYETIKNVSKWWEKIYTPMNVPLVARNPVYSTWYTLHQHVDEKSVESQCVIAKRMGCDMVIVDDGWQTDDNQRGYAYCGDWEVSKSKIKDMKEHVARIKELGMKYVLWYSVPYVGKKAKVYDEFKGKMLCYRESMDAWILDPRSKKVRNYLVAKYESAMKEWGVDGFKLDFIDEFARAPKKEIELDDDYDCKMVEEGVLKLLNSISNRLKTIDDNVLIEFRQRYIGPCMRMFANMFRVVDCPGDFLTNRVGTIDLRLMSNDTSVHSDMVMWDLEASKEVAARQLINCLFSVIQVSVDLESLSMEHKKMLEFYLDFARNHKKTLQEGKLMPKFPELLYPIIESESESEKIIAVYSNEVVDLDKASKDIYIVNGSYNDEVFIRLKDKIGNSTIEVKNCMGQTVLRKENILIDKLDILKIPSSGIAKIVFS